MDQQNLPGHNLPQIVSDDIEAIAESIIPYARGNALMRKYLSLRACGFTLKEACQLAGIHHHTPSLWKMKDPAFEAAEVDAVTKCRQQLSTDHIQIEYTRNIVLALKHDCDVLTKAVATPADLSGADRVYLARIRGHYTPQQLAVLRQLLAGGDGREATFADIVKSLSERDSVMALSRTREEVVIAKPR